MRRVTGAIRNHVLNPACSATEEAAAGAGARNEVAKGVEAGVGTDTGDGGVKGGRCWSAPFMVDIRYDTTTEQVCSLCVFRVVPTLVLSTFERTSVIVDFFNFCCRRLHGIVPCGKLSGTLLLL